ncbi:MAG: retropepsin-like domain-containing protein [Marinifilaceae bacterium]|nr:retropepsin-like domain-containing protein [Marinifilaceae bacterium]
MKRFYIILVLECLFINLSAQEYSKRIINNDTINFKIGKDHGIHIKGSINNSKELDILFDTGANALVIVDSLVRNKLVSFNKDSYTSNQGADGIKKIQKSNSNILKISNNIWDIPSISIHYPKPNFDAVAGYVIFKNDIVEINYTKECIVIHKKIPSNIDEYVKLKMKKKNGLYYIPVSIKVGNNFITDWFEYDTGSNWTLMLDNSFIRKNNLYNKMKLLSSSSISGSAAKSVQTKRVLLESIKIGDFSFYNLPIILLPKINNGLKHNGILGSYIMKRFDTILDLKNQYLYIKPNKYASLFLK